MTKTYNENKVELIGTIEKGKFYNTGNEFVVNVLINRNGYGYRVRLADKALFQKVLTLTGKVAITGKLRIYNDEVYILADQVVDLGNDTDTDNE